MELQPYCLAGQSLPRRSACKLWLIYFQLGCLVFNGQSRLIKMGLGKLPGDFSFRLGRAAVLHPTGHFAGAEPAGDGHRRLDQAAQVLTGPIGVDQMPMRKAIHTPIATIMRFSVCDTKPSGTLLLPPTQAHFSSRLST